MATATYKCGCGFEKQVPAEYSGKRIKCPKCQTENRVGPVGGEASTQAAKPAAPAAQRPAAAKPGAPKAVIKFYCPHCGQKMGVAAEHAGKRVRCTKCKEPVSIPMSSEATAGPSASRASAAPKAPAVSGARPVASPPAAGSEELGELGLRLDGFGAGMDDLLAMEQQTQAVEPIEEAKKPQGTRGPEPSEAVAELMRLQARAGGRREKTQPGKQSTSRGLVMAASALGAVAWVILLGGFIYYLVVQPPETSYAGAEDFIKATFMTPRLDLYETGSESPEPAVAEPNSWEPNEPEAAYSESGEAEPAEMSGDEEGAGLSRALGMESERREPTAEEMEGYGSVYGPELVEEMAKEQEEVAEYLRRHEEDGQVSGGALERMTPVGSGLSHAIGVVYSEPSMAVVGRAQCYLPDRGEYGIVLTYSPRRSADKGQMVTFILETSKDKFYIEGARARHSLTGWGGAASSRGDLIEARADSIEALKKLVVLPGWYWSLGVPALAIAGVVILVSVYIVFQRTEHMGTSVIVPVYNVWALADVGGRPGWLSLLVAAAVVPVMFGGIAFYGAIAVVALIMLYISIGVANELDKSAAFGLGLWLLPPVFYPMLAGSMK